MRRLLVGAALVGALGLGLAGRAAFGSDDHTSKGYLVPVGTISLAGVEGRLDHLAVDTATKRLFASGLENHSVEVIDLASLKRVHEITGISEPQGLLFIPDAKRLIVASRGDGTCRSFNSDTFEEGPWVDLGRNADNAHFDAALKRVYVGSGAEPGPGVLSAIALESLVPAGEGGKPAPPISPADLLLDRPRQSDALFQVALGAHPESFQVDPQSHRVYVNVPDEHYIAVIDSTSDGLTLSTTWPVTPQKNFPMALDAATSRLFVICRVPARVVVYDTKAGKPLSETPCVGDGDDAFYDKALGRLYVIGGAGHVDVFDAKSEDGKLTLLGSVTTAPKARTGLFIPDLALLAVIEPHTGEQETKVLLFRTAP